MPEGQHKLLRVISCCPFMSLFGYMCVGHTVYSTCITLGSLSLQNTLSIEPELISGVLLIVDLLTESSRADNVN